MAAAHDAVSTNATTIATVSSWTHTPVGSPTLVIVVLTMRTAVSGVVVTYGGAAMTSLFAGSDGKFFVFYKEAPAAGAQTVTATWDTASRCVAAAETFIGSTGIPANVDTTDAAAVTVVSDTVASVGGRDLVVHFAGNTGASTGSFTGDGTEIFDLPVGAGAPFAAGYYLTGSGSVVVTATVNLAAAEVVSHLACRIRGSGGGPRWFV